MSITKSRQGVLLYLICVGFNPSLDAWVWFPTWARKFQTVWGRLWILSAGRIKLKRTGGGWIYHWIDFSNLHKVTTEPTKWSNSAGEQAHWRFAPHGHRQHVEWPGWVLLGDRLGRERFLIWARAILHSWIMTDWVLGIGLKSCVSL